MSVVANRELTPPEVRARFRDGVIAPTAGWAHGYTQTNVVAVPQEWAYEFLLFAQRNPQACPVLDVGDPGDPSTVLAPGADVRTDVPLYRVWENGALVTETSDVTDHWRDDLVTFHIGCSFTFESALFDAGIPLRHVEQGVNVPMYTTQRRCRSAGRIGGPLVVSMRPIPGDQVAAAVQLSARMPAVHGAPVHVGAPDALLTGSIDAPDFGDVVRPEPGDVPVFWACGVTPQAAVMASRLPFAITHAPGHMFVTDVPDSAYVSGVGTHG